MRKTYVVGFYAPGISEKQHVEFQSLSDAYSFQMVLHCQKDLKFCDIVLSYHVRSLDDFDTIRKEPIDDLPF